MDQGVLTSARRRQPFRLRKRLMRGTPTPSGVPAADLANLPDTTR